MAREISDIIAQFKEQCESARTEDDIKVASNIFFYAIGNTLEIRINSHNEITSAHGGRVDSIYNNIYFEYKRKGLFTTHGTYEAVYGRDERDHGLFHYLINFALEESGGDKQRFLYYLTSSVGVGFDGEKFVFCRFKDSLSETNIYHEYKTKHFPRTIERSQKVEFEFSSPYDFSTGVKRILLLLRSTNRKHLNAQSLCETFSARSEISQNSIVYLYSLLETSLASNQRIQTLYTEWDRIFGTIYGDQESDFVKQVEALQKFYPIKFRNKDDVKKTLFIIQTYYSILIKLLIQNLFANLKLPSAKPDFIKDKSDLIKLFYGQKEGFDQFIDNFFEIHFFEWFTLAQNFDLNIINNLIIALDDFETTASVIKPEIVGDVLRETYESLMPKDLRHMMGEYYTVDWLADFTIRESGYDSGLDTTVLDPTCGSGIFITHLIKLFREKHPELSYNQFVHYVVNNFVGFDINPIAVIQAKGNYILALGDITSLCQPISIPIYMCDSILVPTVHAKQEPEEKSISIRTSVGDFSLPILRNRDESIAFLNTLSKCILSDYTSFEDFNQRLKNEFDITLDVETAIIARRLYSQLLDFHNAGKDGFWPIILKNSFAPLFCEKQFDYVIGNPPWIAWKAMSESYRDLTLEIWLSYGIFEKSAYDKITSHDDFAMAVTYVAIDHYLKNNGCAALILPQTFVKSLKGGEGFRKFLITRDEQEIPFSIVRVCDLLRVNPFKGIAANRTSVYIFRKNLAMNYPMDDYREYFIIPSKKIDSKSTLSEVDSSIAYAQLSAKPINENIRSPWLTLPPEVIHHTDAFLGRSPYKGRKGIEPCGAKGIYLIDVLSKRNNLLLIKNLIHRSRLKEAKRLGVRQGYVEQDHVYPMVGGRNIEKWGINSYIYMLVPHYNHGDGIYRGIPDEKLKTTYYRTYDWLFYFHNLLRDTRIRSGKFFDIEQFPWYRLDNVGEYTFMPYKVLWQEQAKSLNCCVVSSISDEFVMDKTVVTDSKVLFVSFDNEMEAHYLCGVLNSSLIEKIIQGYTIYTNRGIDIVANIKIPKFDPENEVHVSIAKISLSAHEAFVLKDTENIKSATSKLDDLVAIIFRAE
ncbi:MAG: hypothetical protein NC421_00320 [Lachnospiraceae bacterium]|nr:hypothetical protein [Lachnospiraceae bacterium]